MRYYFVAVGVTCLSVAAWLLVRRLAVVFRGQHTYGKVTGFVSSEDDGSIYYRPTVEFHDGCGRRHVFTASAGGSRQTPGIGTEVPVRYDPQAPETAYIVSFLHLWAAPVALAVLGVASLLACHGD